MFVNNRGVIMKKLSFLTKGVLLLTVLLLILTTYTTITYNRSINKEIQTSLKHIVEANVDASLSNAVKNYKELLNKLQKVSNQLSHAISSNDDIAFYNIIKNQEHQYSLGKLSFYSNDNLDSIKQKIKVPDLPLLKKSIIKNHSLIYITDETTTSTINILLPVYNNSKYSIEGILCCSVTQNQLNSYLLNFDMQFKSRCFLVSPNGTCLTNTNTFQYNSVSNFIDSITTTNSETSHSILNEMKKNSSDFVTYTFNNQKYYLYYTPSSINDWYLFSIFDAESLDSTANTFKKISTKISNQFVIITFIFECLILFIQVYHYIKSIKTNARLILEKEKYETVIKHSQGVIWEYDILTDTMIKSDKNSGIYTGTDYTTNLSATLLNNDIIYPEDIAICSDFLHDLKLGKKEIHSIFRAKDITGEYVWFDLVGITILKENLPVTIIGKMTNVDKQQKEYERLKQHALEDPLTKLYNRSAASAKINTIISQTELSHMHAFCMIDIDNFKSLNDNLGHTFGDAVLIEFSSKITNLLQENDLAFRIGGDEFAVFLTDIPSLEYVEDTAQKISNILKELLLGNNRPFDISGSVGISLYPNHGATFEDLFARADIALYHSKDLGKDCYSIYTKETMGGLDITLDSHKEATTRDAHAMLDNTLLSNIIDVLFDAKDLSFTINFILSLVGSYYNLDSIGICEYTSDYKLVSTTYEWTSNKCHKLGCELKKILKENAELISYYKDTKSGVFYCRDIENLEINYRPFKDYMLKHSIQGFIQCAIADSGNYTGYIYANIAKNKKQLEKHEVDTISFISKILGGYIRKLRSEEMARALAKKDLLTDSYNVNSFTEEAENILEVNHYDQFALVNFDINKFKQINETFGYIEGDNLLVEIANLFKASLHENELFGRIMGDRFLLLLHYDIFEDLDSRIRSYIEQFSEIIRSQRDCCNLSIIMGVYLIEPNDRVVIAVDRANIARKSIRERHKNNYSYFDRNMKIRIIRRQNIENIMVSSLENKEFKVFYQPKFNLVTQEIYGAEALIRWVREDGTIYPNDFIPIFEDNGFIREIDYFVLEEVCRQLRYLIDNNFKVVPISVNLSRFHFRDNKLLTHIQDIVSRYDISSELIEFEITESALTDNSSYLLPSLEQIRQLGFRLSMDDFGSGLSSLNALRILPFDILKLDKNFFRTGATTTKEKIVISNIVNMARELKIEIISEGVETIEQADFLRSIGCEYAQGYLFSKPMSSEVFIEQYLSSGHSAQA